MVPISFVSVSFYTRLKKLNYPCICAHADYQILNRKLSVSYPCIIRALEAKTYAFGVTNMAFTGNKQLLYYTKWHIFLHFPPINQILTRIMHGYGTDNF